MAVKTDSAMNDDMENPLEHWEAQLPALKKQAKELGHRKHLDPVVWQIAGARIQQAYLAKLEEGLEAP